MTRRLPRLAPALAVLALTAAACSSSATDPAAKPLSTSEAGALGAALGSPSASAGLAFIGTAIAAGVGTANGSRYAFTANCPLGGTVSGSVEVTNPPNAGGTGTVSGTMSYAPHACVVSAGSRNVTLDGDPSVVTTFSLAVTNLAITPALTSKVTGGLRVDGVACALDYTVSSTAGGRPSVVGTVCGREVSGTY